MQFLGVKLLYWCKRRSNNNNFTVTRGISKSKKFKEQDKSFWLILYLSYLENKKLILYSINGTVWTMVLENSWPIVKLFIFIWSLVILRYFVMYTKGNVLRQESSRIEVEYDNDFLPSKECMTNWKAYSFWKRRRMNYWYSMVLLPTLRRKYFWFSGMQPDH